MCYPSFVWSNILVTFKGRQMIEHTKKLVEDKFTVLGGYEHNAEVSHPKTSSCNVLFLKAYICNGVYPYAWCNIWIKRTVDGVKYLVDGLKLESRVFYLKTFRDSDALVTDYFLSYIIYFEISPS